MNKKNSLTTLFLLVCILVSFLAYLNFVDIEPLDINTKNYSQNLSESEIIFYKKHVEQDSFCRKKDLTSADFEILSILTEFKDFKYPMKSQVPGFICFIREPVWKNYFTYIEKISETNKSLAALKLNSYVYLVANVITSDWLLLDRYYEIKSLNEQLNWLLQSKIKYLLDKKNSLSPLHDINFIDFIKKGSEKEKWLNSSLIQRATPKTFILINSRNGITAKEPSIFFQKNRTHELINNNWDHQIQAFEKCFQEVNSDQQKQFLSKCSSKFIKYETSVAQKYLYNTKGAALINESKQTELQQLFMQMYTELQNFVKLENQF